MMRQDRYSLLGIALIMGITVFGTLLIVAYVQPQPPTRQMSYEIVDQGMNGLSCPQYNYVVNSQSEWEQLWEKSHPNREVPEVDFSRHTIIVVERGCPTTGYGINITGIVDEISHVVVQVVELNPGPGAPQFCVVTSPYQIVMTRKITAEIDFERTSSVWDGTGLYETINYRT
jgi:hypothetical protein